MPFVKTKGCLGGRIVIYVVQKWENEGIIEIWVPKKCFGGLKFV